MLDLDSLAAEFNIPKEAPVIDASDVIDVQPTEIDNPDKLVAQNISKANALLDYIIYEINNGNFSPRMAEVASMLINAINGSTTQLYTKSFNIATLQLKEKALQLKERQIGILEKTGGVKNQNIIVTDRETILRMLHEEPEQKQIGEK
jgi:hypothetical protein